jgi:spectrin beta
LRANFVFRPEVGSQHAEETKRTPSLKDRSAADQHKVTDAASAAETVPSAEAAKVGGLVPSDNWADAGTPVKKITRTDSQKKEKRQRTLSLKTKKPSTVYRPSDALPPVEVEGMLERKHEYQIGGKIATIRTWKHYHTILCGQLLCFFRDKQGSHLSFHC